MEVKIFEVLEKNKGNYEEISKLADEFKDLEIKKRESLTKIKELYRLVFKNFHTKREGIGLKIKGAYDNDCEIFLNRNGISLKEWTHADNTVYIESHEESSFLKLLKNLKMKENNILHFIPKEEKKKIFQDFYEGIEELTGVKTFEIKADEGRFITSENGNKNEIKVFTLNKDNLYIKHNTGYDRTYVNLMHPGLKDKFYIEQIYEDIKEILYKHIAINKISLDKYENFINNLRIKFSKQIIVNSLNKKQK